MTDSSKEYIDQMIAAITSSAMLATIEPGLDAA